MSKDSQSTTNKLEWAVSQAYVIETFTIECNPFRHGACEFCQMDLSIITSGQANHAVSNRASSERRQNRVYTDSTDASDSVYQGKLASMGIIPSKLEPFKATDISNGTYADESDPLGRTWYHIPNLGAKFCDAVRKYSIVANYREAHVIARKKSKESECMWIGIVGDPATYTTGSKRHLIDMMLRNPGQSFDNGIRRQSSKVRVNRAVPTCKRRKRRRRRYPFLSDSRNETESSNSGSVTRRDTEARARSVLQRTEAVRNQPTEEHSNGEDEDSVDLPSSPSSSTPSVLSMDQQVSNSFDFQVRDMIGSPPSRSNGNAKVHTVGKLSKFKLPGGTTSLSINSATTTVPDRDWEFNSVYRDPVLYALKEPPLPSPDAGKVFTFNRCDSRLISAGARHCHNPYPPGHPRSPRLLMSGQDVVRKYSVSDLNELLVSSDGPAVPI
jgi:hypothetical protein